MHPFSGVGVALITPFNDDSSIDFDALARLVDHVIAGGVNYLVALGTTAETPTLSAHEREQVLAFVIRHTGGRVPVVCGVGSNNTSEVIAQLHQLEQSAIAGILSVVPYYNKPTQEGICQHFEAIAKATNKPIILYNVPGRTVTNMLPATALRLAHQFEHIVAIKEASGNLSQCMDLVQGAPAHFSVLSGDDDLVLPQIAIGMHGVISVAANCWTKSFTELVGHALKGDLIKARQLHYELVDGIRLLFAEGNPAGVKEVLSVMGICARNLRLPLANVSSLIAEKLHAFHSALSE